MSPIITKKKFNRLQLLTSCASVIVMFAIISSIFAPTHIPTISMQPTINKDSYVFCRFIDGNNVKYDDIVVLYLKRPAPKFRNAIACSIIAHKPEGIAFCKRVIGLSGDTIEVKDGYVWRNGEKLDPDYLVDTTDGVFGPYTVPEGCVFCMGDNRNYSSDSRYYGAFPAENIFAKVILY